MRKFATAVALAAAVVLPSFAHADDNSDKNGSKENPQSSAAATPGGEKHSAGTVGAMKGAEGGSFTASPEDGKKDSLKAH